MIRAGSSPGLERQAKCAAHLAILFVLVFTRTLLASERTTDDCLAPNEKHQVILQGEDGSSEYELLIRAPNAERPLFSTAGGGYAYFQNATLPENFKCLWSPDSRLVAIFERGTKRSGDTTLYLVKGGKVQAVALPKLMPLLRPHLTAELRASWIRPEVWLPNHQLILSVTGTQVGEEHGNFRFILTVQLETGKTGKVTAKTVSFRQDRSIDFSIK